MIAIPLGFIQVPTAGTDVAITLTAAQLAQTRDGKVARMEVWPKLANAGTFVSVRQAGVTLAELPKPAATGFAESWNTPDCCEGNQFDPTKFSLGTSTSGTDGAYVTLWVA